MKWFASALASVLAKFLPSFFKKSGLPSSPTLEEELRQLYPQLGSMPVKVISKPASDSKVSPVMVNEIEKEFIEGFFNQKDLDLSTEEFTVALKGLMDAKIIRQVEVSGQTMYQLTAVGRAIAKHRYNTNPKEQN